MDRTINYCTRYRLTLVGALFLGIIAILPVITGPHIIQHILTWIMKGSISPDINSSWLPYLEATIQNSVANLTNIFTFGGTSILIVVGVAIETFRELEAQLTMRNYKGFL